MERLSKRVLLIGWDAADWKMIDPLMEAGKMPNLQRLVDNGVMGNVASLTPMLSPILWTSIATGKHADKHGILGFTEPDGSSGKIRPVTSTSHGCPILCVAKGGGSLRHAMAPTVPTNSPRGALSKPYY